jgi:hypothetical protein
VTEVLALEPELGERVRRQPEIRHQPIRPVDGRRPADVRREQSAPFLLERIAPDVLLERSLELDQGWNERLRDEPPAELTVITFPRRRRHGLRPGT